MSERTIFSLSEAARIAQKSKGTISKALSSGRMSYVSRENGQYQIEAAELFRVFPQNRSPTPSGNRSETHRETQETPETQTLKVKLEAAERLLTEREETIDDLRRRLDAEGEERRKLTALLTDHRPLTATTLPESPQEPAGGRLARAWSILRGKA